MARARSGGDYLDHLPVGKYDIVGTDNLETLHGACSTGSGLDR